MVSLTRILTRGVSIRASHAKFSEGWEGNAAKAAVVQLVRPERMLHPGLANLLKALVVARTAAHPIKVLRHDGMVWIWQLIKVHGLISVVTLIISFFKPEIQMYEVHNTGPLYNLGFLIGAILLFAILGFSGGRRRR